MTAADRRSAESVSPTVVPLVAFVGLAAVALAPSLVVAALLAQQLRRRNFSGSWTVPPTIAAGLLWSLVTPHAIHKLATACEKIAAGDGTVVVVTGALWPFWLLTTPTATGLLMLWLDHRARLRGGKAELAARDQIGPVAALARRRERRKQVAAGPFGPAGVLLGVDHRDRVVLVPELQAHAAIVGGSNTGKTNTAEVLLEGHVAAGAGFVVLDGKGGQDLPQAAVRLAARYRRPVALWSIVDYGVPALDALRVAWNPVSGGNPTEVKDRIATAEEQSEPYYMAVASRGLLAAARALTLTTGHVRLDELAACLVDPDTLKARLMAADAGRFAVDIGWLEKLGDSEKSGLRGMGLRLRTLVDSDGGEWLLPSSRELDLYRAISEGWLVVFTLPQGMYPELIPHVTRYALQAINGVCTRIESEGRKANAVVFVDELSAFDGDQLCAGYERGRSAGVRFIVATQSLSNFESAGGPKLIDAALDNSELLIIHRQAVPDAAEKLAGIAGTEEAWEHTHQVSDSRGLGTSRGVDLGLDESGQRARRLTDRFRAHPNTIKGLRQGEAVIISTRPEVQVRRIQVRAGITAAGPVLDSRTALPTSSRAPTKARKRLRRVHRDATKVGRER